MGLGMNTSEITAGTAPLCRKDSSKLPWVVSQRWKISAVAPITKLDQMEDVLISVGRERETGEKMRSEAIKNSLEIIYDNIVTSFEPCG